MRKLLPIASAILPLLITAAAFKWFPKRWLKVLIVIAYPLVMWIACTVVMIVVYGVPGL